MRLVEELALSTSAPGAQLPLRKTEKLEAEGDVRSVS